MNSRKLVGPEGSYPLISVPIDSRPKPNEIKPYLTGLQAHAIDLSQEILSASSEKNSMKEVGDTTSRLITALANDLAYVRIPVVWSLWEVLCRMEEDTEDRLSDSEVALLRELNSALGVLLSHFDLSDHLSDASRRVRRGEDDLDTAFFVELSKDIEDFDNSRAEIFSDSLERAQRFSAIHDLPRGLVPKFTYWIVLSSKVFQRVHFYTIGNAIITSLIGYYFASALVDGSEVRALLERVLQIFGN